MSYLEDLSKLSDVSQYTGEENAASFRSLFTGLDDMVRPLWNRTDRIVMKNQARVLDAFTALKVSEEDFYSGSGYGYHDRGREKLDAVTARIFAAEGALVRPHFVSGTHTINTALGGLLRPGNILLALTGPPYDTLQSVTGFTGPPGPGEDTQNGISGKKAGISDNGEEGREDSSREDLRGSGTLKEYGIKYRELAAGSDGMPSFADLQKSLSTGTPPVVAYIQRSPGYSTERRALTIEKIAELVKICRRYSPSTLIVVDNCYGEFAEDREPGLVGADLVAGSLIKNAWGGLAVSGGYVAGRKELVRKVAARLTAPGLEGRLGAFGGKRNLFMGLFKGPELTGNALKSAIFAAALFSRMGYEVNPAYDDERGDIVQAVHLGKADLVQEFCRLVQSNSPVDAYLTPQPAPVPGYREQVVMAAGTFIQGASGEFTADAPMRPPYAVFIQGALTLSHALTALTRTAAGMYAYR